ncbi:c-type cytochrome [Gilvimarinus sp. F26214L]|uniref:c-type cytochrome n=1 Tax=Gilvimarinus sp. DZF01 TaxID=3461371 RepID=UPI00404677D6
MFRALARGFRWVDRWQTRLSLWQRGLSWLLFFGLMFATGGFLFIWLGFAPIAASSGHWDVTNWLLHFAMRRGVEARTGNIDVPPLEDSGLIIKGAGHYATGCAPCHGAPDQLPSFVTQQTTPQPPYLAPKIQHWEPQQLFWIVKHGVKFTAMPAWPALERDDEIWAMVAFLGALPSLTPAVYQDLAYGSPREAEARTDANPSRVRALVDPAGSALANCQRCHGEQGEGRGDGAVPQLAGQHQEYLLASLKAYAEGKRHSGIMEPVAAGLNDSTLVELATHFAGLPPGTATTPTDPESVAQGARIALQGIPEQGIPACAGCHGPGPGPRNPFYPNLSGQGASYLSLQLQLFKAGLRGGSPYAHIMESIAPRLEEAQMEDVAAYYSSIESSGAGNP